MLEMRVISIGILFEGSLTFWRVQAGADLREESEAVNESFWDAPGVEIEAKQDLGNFWAIRPGLGYFWAISA